MVSQELRRQLEGYGLTTANILYRRPDHPWLLQSYVWQDYDLCPVFSALNKFLNFSAGDLGRPVALGHRGACAFDQACRDPRDRRRVPAALRTEVRLSDVRSTLGPSGIRAPSRKTARPCHFLYPRSLKSFDLFCLSSSLSIARDERPSTIPMTERLVSAFATITCTGLLVAQ